MRRLAAGGAGVFGVGAKPFHVDGRLRQARAGFVSMTAYSAAHGGCGKRADGLASHITYLPTLIVNDARVGGASEIRLCLRPMR